MSSYQYTRQLFYHAEFNCMPFAVEFPFLQKGERATDGGLYIFFKEQFAVFVVCR
jgi:hypothetical protein